MIKTLPEPCWVIEPNTSGHDDIGETHYLDVDAAARSLASYIADVGSEDGPEEAEKARERHAITQKPEVCRQVACEGCGDVFEDDEDGVSHAVTEDDVERLLRIAAWCDWQRGESAAIYCTTCVVPDRRPPGPGPDDVPLFCGMPCLQDCDETCPYKEEVLARCEITGLVLAECAGACCRPDLKQVQPVPEVWMRVTGSAGRRVVPSEVDVAGGNVHALFQVAAGRTTRPEVVDMVRELCEDSSHLVRVDGALVEKQQLPVRRSKGKARRQKAGRNAMRPPRYHRTVEPPLMVQLYESVEPSSSAEAGAARPAASRPAARIDAIDTAVRIDSCVGAWLNHLEANPPAPQPVAGREMTEAELRMQDTIARLRHLASLLPSLDNCGRRTPGRDEQNQVICCEAHVLEVDIHRWWTWARVVTGWDTPAWQPANTCPLCGTRGTLRVRLEEKHATCINDACRETWDETNIGLLADHIRAENNDTEEAS